MALSITFTHKDFPKGTPFAVFPLGSLPSGETVEIDEEMEREFLAVRGKSVREFFKGNDSYKVSGTPEVKGKEATDIAASAPTTTTEEGGES